MTIIKDLRQGSAEPLSFLHPFALFVLVMQLFLINVSCQNHPVVHIQVTGTDGTPLENAVIILNDNPQYMFVTGEDGTVNFSLPAGSYQLASYRHDFLDYHSTLSVAGSNYTYSISHLPALHWSTSPADAPIGVGEKNGLRIAAAGHKLYLWAAYGGEPGTTNYGGLTGFYEYDTQTDTWQKLPDAPFSSDYGISTVWGRTPQGDDAIYIIKGRWTGQRTWFARYHIDQGFWISNLAHQIPWQTDLGNQYSGNNFQNYPRNGAVMVYTNEGYIYLFPGSGYGYEKYDWYRYSIAQNQWTAMGELPHRQGPGNAAVWVRGDDAGLDQDYLYVQFGITPSGNYTSAEFWRYGLTSETWENMADHAYGADDGSAMVWDGAEYIFHSPGAYQEQSWDFGMSQKRQLMRYHIPTDTWEEMEKAPYNRWGGWDDGGGMVIIGNAIYAMKGGDDIAWAEGEQPASGGDIPNNMLWVYYINPDIHELTVEEPVGEGSISIPEGTTSFTHGTHVWVEAHPAEGWKLDKWLVNGTFFCNNTEIEILMDGDKSLQAIFSMITTSYFIPDEDLLRVTARPGEIHISTWTSVEFAVFDLLGRKVFDTNRLAEGNHSIQHTMQPGVYIIQVMGDAILKNRKIYLSP